MIELRMIVPAEPPRGSRDTLEFKFLAAFGGYTVTKGNGAWMPGGPGRAGESPVVYEGVLIYDIVADPGSGLRGYSRLRRIARWAAGEFGQKSIYLRGPGGEVEFVEPVGEVYIDPLSDPNSFKGPGPVPGGPPPSPSYATETVGQIQARAGGWHKHPKLTVPTRSEADAEESVLFADEKWWAKKADARAAKDAPEHGWDR